MRWLRVCPRYRYVQNAVDSSCVLTCHPQEPVHTAPYLRNMRDDAVLVKLVPQILLDAMDVRLEVISVMDWSDRHLAPISEAMWREQYSGKSPRVWRGFSDDVKNPVVVRIHLRRICNN